jgi:hypothetical protein
LIATRTNSVRSRRCPPLRKNGRGSGVREPPTLPEAGLVPTRGYFSEKVRPAVNRLTFGVDDQSRALGQLHIEARHRGERRADVAEGRANRRIERHR